MSLFEKAKDSDKRLKMYIYGKTGTGKTLTSLQFPSPAVVDAEKGTEHYGAHFDFHRVKTSDPNKVHAAIDELLVDPGPFKTFVIDPMSVIYDQILRMKEDRMKEKTGNLHYELQPLDYKTIKTEVKILMNKLLALDMNIIVTARSKPLYRPGKFMEQIGEKPEGHKDMPYMFDVVLELYQDEAGTRWARVEKDRTNNLPHEFEFSYDAFVEYIGADTLERAADLEKQKVNVNETNGRTTKVVLDGEELFTAGVKEKSLVQLQDLLEDFNEDDLKETLKEEYEVESILDLTDKAAKSLIGALLEHQKAEQAEG